MRFAIGLILPPPEIKSVIDRTAWFVARSANPPSFEEKIREGQRSDPKFAFLNPADPYHAYYRDRLVKVARGEVGESGSGLAGTGAENGEGEATKAEPIDIGVEPPQPEFMLDMPNITAIDLDTMKLTALFTAQRGRAFLSNIAGREMHNPQFEFLRPNHSLFGYFNRLVEQYTKVLQPTKEMLEKVKVDAADGSKWSILELARKHAKWEKYKREQDKKRQDDQEAERDAFAEIDWHDYAIVQTIEFTAADANAELPMPMSVQEVENMTLAQKRMAAAIMETTAEDVEAHKARQAALEAEAAAAVSSAGVDDDAVMEESEGEEEREFEVRRRQQEEERRRDIERAHAVQASSTNIAGPMKIRTDYVPKLGAKNKAATTTCAVCGQEIPVDELQEHMRIELLDPKWKSQRDAIESRKAQASELQRGANVTASLKNLARTRVDIFGGEVEEEDRKKAEEIEKEKRKEREKVVWDGHTATKVSTMDKFSTNVNFDEQIAAIHRAKGLGPQDMNAMGPGIGPSVSAASVTSLPIAPPSLPPAPAFSGAATVSSGPQPASAFPSQPPVMLPPLHFQGLNASQPFGYQPPGTVRGADQMEGAADDIPPAKKQRVHKLLSGQLYPESDWIQLHPHPISLQIQLPSEPSKPEWKLDGQIILVPDLPVTLLVSTLRDRFIQFTGSTIKASAIRFSYQGKMLPNGQTIAYHNLEDEDLVVLSIQDKKKK